MSTLYKTSKRRSNAAKTQRYWSRTESLPPWHPWGTVQLLWLALLFLAGVFLVAPSIEADVRTQVADRLHAAGINSAATTTNGQSVQIRADATETNAMAVQTIAATTRCRTWAGQLPCPTTIDVRLDTPIHATTALAVRPHRFVASRVGDDVTLSGEVPNTAEQDRILDIARQYFDVVANEMVVTNEAATANYVGATHRALAVVGHLQQGQAKWDNEFLSVVGFADAAGAMKSREYFDAIGSGSAQGAFKVSTPENTENCNDKFRKVLAEESIQFQTNSAIITGSEQLLRNLSQLASTCPGRLTVAGHTDDRGAAEMNKALSQARADAVLAALTDLGVEPGRLVAIGHGEIQPIADNLTAEGRAANRRISISTQSGN